MSRNRKSFSGNRSGCTGSSVNSYGKIEFEESQNQRAQTIPALRLEVNPQEPPQEPYTRIKGHNKNSSHRQGHIRNNSMQNGESFNEGCNVARYSTSPHTDRDIP